MHNKFMRLGLGSAFAWNSSLWCADQAQRAEICQSEEEWCWPTLPRDRREYAQPQLDAAENPSAVIAVGLLQPIGWYRLWVGLSSKGLPQFGERDKVFATDCLLSGSKLNWKSKKPQCFFSWVSEPSHRSASQKTGGKWWLGGSDQRSERTQKQRGKGKACDVIPGAN